jgi:hypothetical protein
MKSIIVLLAFICNAAIAQTHFRVSAATNHNVSVSFQTHAESIKNLVYGFGISIFTNEGNKGRDYTGFYDYRSPDVYESVRSNNGSIFVFGGKRFNHDIVVMPKLGLGTAKWYYNGKTGENLWYVRRDAGTYLLVGGEVTKEIKNWLIGAGYDNFNGALFILGIKINQR